MPSSMRKIECTIIPEEGAISPILFHVSNLSEKPRKDYSYKLLINAYQLTKRDILEYRVGKTYFMMN
jgi:hypothetical protein